MKSNPLLILSLCFVFIVVGCNEVKIPSSKAPEVKPQATVSIDSAKDSVSPSAVNMTESRKEKVRKEETIAEDEKKEIVKETETKTSPSRERETEVVHRFQNKKVSVIEGVWKNNEQFIQVFSINDSLVYTFTNERKSYTVRTELFFRENGSLDKAVTHTNPGASMYWYQETITFSEINEPLWKTSERFPMESLDAIQQSYWDQKKKIWIVQQTMECNPPGKE